MNILPIFTFVVESVASVGAGAVVGNVVKATTPETVSTAKRVAIGVGSFVLSNMVRDAASKYTKDGIDATVEQLQELKAQFKKKDD